MQQDPEGAYYQKNPGKGSDRRIDELDRNKGDLEDKSSSEQLFENQDNTRKTMKEESYAHLVYAR